MDVLISTGMKFRKKVPVWYTGIYQPISSTDELHKISGTNKF
jgi:hypothetical protein